MLAAICGGQLLIMNYHQEIDLNKSAVQKCSCGVEGLMGPIVRFLMADVQGSTLYCVTCWEPIVHHADLLFAGLGWVAHSCAFPHHLAQQLWQGNGWSLGDLATPQLLPSYL